MKILNRELQAQGTKELFLTIAIYAAIRLCYLDLVPMWDGFAYLEVIFKTIQVPLNLLNFEDVSGHNCWLFMALVALPQYLGIAHTELLNLTTTALGFMGIYYFHRLLTVFLDVRDCSKFQVEHFALLALFGLHPVYISNSINFNLDFGLTVFLLMFLYGLLSSKRNLTLVSALLLTFTKETGILLMVVAIAFYLFVFYFRASITSSEKFAAIRKLKFLMIPLIAFLLYCYVKKYVYDIPLFFTGVKTEYLPRVFLYFNPFRATFISAMVVIFVMNFNWLLSAFIACFGLRNAALWLFNEYRPKSGPNSRNFFFLWLFFGLSTYLLTRFPNGANARYFMMLYPLLVILSWRSITLLVPRLVPQRVVMVLSAVLIFSSNFRTMDPLTTSIFGTFQMGKHKLWRTVHLWEPNRNIYAIDGLVYNLQFTNYHYLLSQVFASVKPGEQVPLVTPIWSKSAIGYLDKKNHTRVLPHQNSYQPNMMEAKELFAMRPKPQEIYYLEFPNFNNAPYLRTILADYQAAGAWAYQRNGYQIIFRRFQLQKTG